MYYRGSAKVEAPEEFSVKVKPDSGEASLSVLLPTSGR